MSVFSERRVADQWNNPKEKPLIRLENVSKHFGHAKALDQVTLSIYEKEFFSLLGPSGCGKSTLLRLIAGFEKPDSGKIYIDQIDVTQTPPYQQALLHLLLLETSCFRYWGQGTWTEYAREIHRRGQAAIAAVPSGFSRSMEPGAS